MPGRRTPEVHAARGGAGAGRPGEALHVYSPKPGRRRVGEWVSMLAPLGVSRLGGDHPLRTPQPEGRGGG